MPEWLPNQVKARGPFSAFDERFGGFRRFEAIRLREAHSYWCAGFDRFGYGFNKSNNRGETGRPGSRHAAALETR
jgi:hypothetical protein